MDPDEEKWLRHEMCLHMIRHGLKADLFMELPKTFQVAILHTMWNMQTVPEPA